jgi:two-component system cell cycle response regulator DivK
MAIILLVEDIDDNAALIQRVLISRGHQVLWAKNGEQALELSADNEIELVLLDLGLPDIDGQTLVPHLRSMPDMADVPILVVTAWPKDTALNMVTAYGCNGYLSKPVDIHQLMDMVREHLPA